MATRTHARRSKGWHGCAWPPLNNGDVSKWMVTRGKPTPRNTLRPFSKLVSNRKGDFWRAHVRSRVSAENWGVPKFCHYVY